MTCSICKKRFVRTKTENEYYAKKTEYEEEISNIIDSLTDEELNKIYDKLWDEIIHFDALLLLPNTSPKICYNKECVAITCFFCCNKNNRYCALCKLPPPPNY